MIAAGAKVTVDPVAKAAYLVKGNQWVAFDNPQTIYMKIEAARAMGLGGTMVWAADLDDAEYSMLRLIAARADPGPFVPYSAIKPPRWAAAAEVEAAAEAAVEVERGGGGSSGSRRWL